MTQTDVTHKLVQLRASAVPLFMRCAASVERPEGEVRIDPYSDAAELGTAVHAALRDPEGEIPKPPPGVDEREYYMLVRFGLQAWEQIGKDFGNDQADCEIEAQSRIAGRFQINGHIDRIKIAKDAIRILDWKSGRVESDVWPQMMAYALLAIGIWSRHSKQPSHEAPPVTIVVVWLRERVLDVREFTFVDIEHWVDLSVLPQVDRLDTYSPGPHCIHCPRSATCPGRSAWQVGAIAAMGDGSLVRLPQDVRELGPFLKHTLEHARAVAKAADQTVQAIRDLVHQHGQLPTVEGKALKLVSSERREVDPLRAWPVLEGRLTHEQIADAMKLSIGALEAGVVKNAVRGKGGVAKRELTDALTQAGAIKTETSWTLREIAIEKGNGDE